MSRLWDKGESLDAQIHAFTVGNDPILDEHLVRWDVFGSAAHAKMLAKIGILSESECRALLGALQEIRTTSLEGKFSIPAELEDCHTAIESVLTEKLGDIGKKIHAGRSRNDQVIVAMRLYLRHHTLVLANELLRCVEAFYVRFDELADTPMPGYTHMQPAMPSSIGMWIHSFVEGGLDLVRDGFALLNSLDTNPLGAASGFGVPIPLDRQHTATLLGFTRVQRSPIDVQNSRGRHELKVLRWGVDIASWIEKLSCDLMLYLTEEYAFFKLPKAFTTGSSIMPQKRNPDVVELLRGSSAKLRAAAEELSWVTAKLPTSYHRDFQLTKPPVFRAMATLYEILGVTRNLVLNFEVVPENLNKRMTPEVFATYEAFIQVRSGVPFREAYKSTSQKLERGEIRPEALAQEFKTIQDSCHQGIKAAQEETLEHQQTLAALYGELENCEEAVFTLK